MTPRSVTGLRRLLLAALLPGLALLPACTDSRESPAGRGNIRAINALPDAGEVQFKIEAVVLDTPGYQASTVYFGYDSLTYDFNFDYSSGLTGELERLATTEIAVQPATDYTLILAGTQQSARVLTLELPGFQATGDTASLELWLLNLSGSAGNVDFYVGAPGFDPATVAPDAAGVAPDGIVSVGDVPAEEVQIVVTPAGDPGAELIRSEAATLSGDDRVLVSLLDSAGENTSPYVVLLTGERGAVRLVDDSAPVRVQVAHAAQGEGAIDVYEEPEGGALTTPLFADLAFGEVTPLADLPAADDLGTIDVTLTQAGNPGVILDEQLTAFPDGAATLQVVAGSQAEDTLLVATLVGSRRQLADSARLALYNAIEDQGVVDVYLIEPGDSFDRATSRTLVNNAQLGSTVPQFRTAPGTYALYIVRDNDDVILLGPVELVIAAGDVRQLITTDTADPGVSGLIDIDLTAF